MGPGASYISSALLLDLVCETQPSPLPMEGSGVRVTRGWKISRARGGSMGHFTLSGRIRNLDTMFVLFWQIKRLTFVCRRASKQCPADAVAVSTRTATWVRVDWQVVLPCRTRHLQLNSQGCHAILWTLAAAAATTCWCRVLLDTFDSEPAVATVFDAVTSEPII